VRRTENFQKQNNLVADGTVGFHTWEKLLEIK
jgi:peptidoglycan hydrolase-like protein with peptidoglycan-binding domain